MKKFFRIISLLCFVVTSVVFALVFIGEKEIPDKIEIVENEEFYIQNVYVPKIMQKEIPVFSVTKKEEKNSTISKNYSVDVSLLNTIPVKSASVVVNQRQYVVPSGQIFGVKIFMDGVMIVGMDAVKTSEGTSFPAKDAGLKLGDIIYSVNGQSVSSITELNKAFYHSGHEAEILYYRKGKKEKTSLRLAISKDGKEKRAGLWVRDSTAGVGTLTFYEPKSGIFGGLGHAICDSDTGNIVPLKSGQAVATKIQGCYKGAPGVTGELCGVFQSGSMGNLYANLPNGVYGKLKKWNAQKECLPVATKKEVKIGKAQIISTIDNTGPHVYNVIIKKVYPNSDENGKNLIIEITDPILIEKTGGIVQGMSGSPILQNGMLVGAVTHVFVNNALEGYGVFAETMLKQSKFYETQKVKKAS